MASLFVSPLYLNDILPLVFLCHLVFYGHKENRSRMVHRFTLILLLIGLFAVPATAKEDCAGAADDIAGPLAVVKGMADYKAAMDAGYAACMVSYPKEFAALRTVNDFMQSNMQKEMDHAQDVLSYMIEQAAAGECATPLKENARHLVDGQYTKSYARRHRIMSKAGLVTEDQDSCLIVREMVEKYDTYYDDYEQLKYVLYESSQKQGRKTGTIDRKAIKAFEKARDQLPKSE